MRMSHHLILILAEMLDVVRCSRVVFKTWHHELLRKAMRGDFLGEGQVEDGQTVGLRLLLETLARSFNLLPMISSMSSTRGSSRPFTTQSSRDSGCHSRRVTCGVSENSRCERFPPTRMVTEEVGNPPPRDVQKAATFGGSRSK